MLFIICVIRFVFLLMSQLISDILHNKKLISEYGFWFNLLHTHKIIHNINYIQLKL